MTKTEQKVLRRLQRFGSDDGVRINQGLFKDKHRTISVLNSLVEKGLVERVYYIPGKAPEREELKAKDLDWDAEDYEAMAKHIFQAMKLEGWRP